MQFDLRSMAEHMGAVAWAVVIVLFIMSMYSIAVMIERYWTFRQATQQSRKYAPEVARYLKAGQDQGGDRRLRRQAVQAVPPRQGAEAGTAGVAVPGRDR